ncbi:Crp/Fnr family transcriptional regulator [uncultured Draconibacterium sp.]|uniref:Crp/Fnr family transcriptional regulator n=1 Tax=uncultured Draconibacterium sp. TaxID=1573823 RepID=UPI0029C09CC5|nr:Crp/Fnr family transcriptional regulator [uncultured Draconibacterium sp.]
MQAKQESCKDCQIKSSVVAILSHQELEVLEKGCLQTEFAKGELIFKEGSPANHIVYVREGFVKLSKKGIGGKDYILNISKAGAYLGINNLNNKTKQFYISATALTSTKVCFIDIEKFSTLLSKNCQFATEVISYIFEDEMNYYDRLVNNVQQQVPGRLANTLFYFRYNVYGENPFNLNITKVELAALIGTSRESVTRLLKEFQDEKIIEMNKSVINIIDEAKLERIRQKG